MFRNSFMQAWTYGRGGEGETAEARQVHWRVMKGTSVSMEAKKGIRHSVILPAVSRAPDEDMGCSAASQNTWRGEEVCQRCVCCFRMGWREL